MGIALRKSTRLPASSITAAARVRYMLKISSNLPNLMCSTSGARMKNETMKISKNFDCFSTSINFSGDCMPLCPRAARNELQFLQTLLNVVDHSLL